MWLMRHRKTCEIKEAITPMPDDYYGIGGGWYQTSGIEAINIIDGRPFDIIIGSKIIEYEQDSENIVDFCHIDYVKPIIFNR